MPAHAHLPARAQPNRLVALRLPPRKERRLPLQSVLHTPTGAVAVASGADVRCGVPRRGQVGRSAADFAASAHVTKPCKAT